MLLGSETITVQPKQQSITDGLPVISNDGAAYTLTGTVVPPMGEMVEQLPEWARLRKVWTLYIEGETIALAVGKPSPVITTSKGICKILREDDYTSHTTGLPCKSYILVEVADDE